MEQTTSEMTGGTTRTESTTCVVVGGGPAGMMLGLLLARAGVEVRVLEKHGDFLRDFRGDTVHPSTMRLLDGLGLGEQFAALPQSHVRSVAFPVDEDQTMVTVGDFRRLRGTHPYIAMVPQWDLLSLLAGAAASEPTFTLMLQSEVTGLLRDGGRVSGVRYRDPSGVTRELRAHLVVAADGRTSLARREADLPVREYACPLDAWWFRLPRREGDPAGALLPRVGRGRMAILIPREGYFQIAYIGRKGTDDALRARGIEAFRADVADLVPALADRVDELRSMDDVKWLDVRLNLLRHWSVDGLLCIGDAAHAMSPVGGVGINLAVQDAVAAATLLAEPLRRGRVRNRDLRAVQRRRIVATRLVQGLQRAMHRGLVEPALAGRLTGPPPAVLALLRRVPGITAVPAYLIGVGFRPESVPPYARRPPQPATAGSTGRRVDDGARRVLSRWGAGRWSAMDVDARSQPAAASTARAMAAYPSSLAWMSWREHIHVQAQIRATLAGSGDPVVVEVSKTPAMSATDAPTAAAAVVTTPLRRASSGCDDAAYCWPAAPWR